MLDAVFGRGETVGYEALGSGASPRAFEVRVSPIKIDGVTSSGLVTMALNGFVIYALAASGPSFRRG